MIIWYPEGYVGAVSRQKFFNVSFVTVHTEVVSIDLGGRVDVEWS